MAWLLAGPVFWSACSSDEPVGPEILPPSPPVVETVRATIRVGAGESVETRASGGDEYARQHEFIHSLCVFIVNEHDVIEKKLMPDFSDNPEARTGDLLGWLSGSFEIPVGKKRVYAFANWETVTGGDPTSDWGSILNKKEEDTLTPEELAISFDAAEKLKTEELGWGTYLSEETGIPMSASREVTLLSSSQSNTISIELIRLVACVRIAMDNWTEQSIYLSDLRIGKFANAVSLLPGGTVTDSGRGRERVLLDGDTEKEIQGSGTSFAYHIYVNETFGEGEDDRFTIGVTVKEGKEGEPHRFPEAKTRESALERNYFYPISLRYTQYDLELNVQARIAPIGVYPITTYVRSNLLNTVDFHLPEGCTFSLDASLFARVNGISTEMTGLTYTWTVLEPSAIAIDTPDAGSDGSYTDASIGGHLTALNLSQDQASVLYLAIGGTHNGETIDQTYMIHIDTQPLSDLPDYFRATARSVWAAAHPLSERIHLFTNPKGE